VLAVLDRGEEGEQLVAVAVQLAGTDALDGQELARLRGRRSLRAARVRSLKTT
jgi:hypothetical protein